VEYFAGASELRFAAPPKHKCFAGGVNQVPFRVLGVHKVNFMAMNAFAGGQTHIKTNNTKKN
jgi:hypothetical protein